MSEQELLDKYVEKWEKIGFGTGRCDFEKAREDAIMSYRAAGYPPPKWFYVTESPWACAELEAKLKKVHPTLKGNESKEEVLEKVNKVELKGPFNDFSGQIYGAMDAGWLATYDYLWHEKGHRECRSLEGLMRLAEVCGWWAPYTEHCIFQDRPEYFRLDDQLRLHSEDGMAVRYYDGNGVYAWHGVRLPKDPVAVTVADIEAESNVEVRRSMMEAFGVGEYVAQTGAQKIAEDDFGTLWRKDMPGDEAIAMVEVVNSTLNDDGTTKTYFLRVPPDMQTAREAVAWTFNKKSDEYLPELET